MIPISFVTVEHALTQRVLDTDDHVPLLQATLWQASSACLDHVKVYTVEDIPAGWLHVTIPDGFDTGVEYIPILPASYSTDSPKVSQYVIPPGQLKSAILLHTGDLWENREAGVATPFSPAVLSLLEDLRDPTLQ